VTEYDAVVYDLDGTLVDLSVDWDSVARDVAAVLESQDVNASDMDLWAMLDIADDTGNRDAVEAAIAEHECRGAEQSTRLPTAGDLPQTVPVAVCSLNCEQACRLALEQHGIEDCVEVVVGRDTVATEKPDPEPLLTAVRRLGSDPDRTLFIGDSERDELTAKRAGTAYRYV
jgi:phosphoglycolate phosphatase-like HAD superfamily hydrolase